MKKTFLILILVVTLFMGSYSLSQSALAADIEIIPTADNPNPGSVTDCVAGSGSDCENGTVWDRYNQQLSKGTDLGTQFATGIFSWNSIKLYASYIIRFLSQVGLLIGAVMIIVAGYKYATAVFGGKSPGTADIKNAIIGVLIVIFSYAIIRILQAASGIG